VESQIIQLLRSILLSVHVLVSAGWFGAMLYSLIVLHPRARQFLRNPSQFEEFIAVLASGARWKVLAGCGAIALTGLVLLLLPVEQEPSTTWRVFVATKTVLFIVAIVLFCFTSWVLWPARVLASAEEIPKFQHRFRMIAVALVTLVGLSIVLGVVGSHL
jgi:putative copper export protein